MELVVERLTTASPDASPMEIVERKGLGHPDTICDALAENLSAALSRYYLDHFGAILHHNVDKALLCAGEARAAFGGGEVRQPIDIYLAGRATTQYRGVSIPVDRIAVETSEAWLDANLRYLDVRSHVRIHSCIRATSSELAALFLARSQTGVPLANDTSFGVGFAPLDALERAVFAAERALNASETKARCEWIGEDVKVMGARYDQALSLTVACAMVGRHVHSLTDYLEKKASIRAVVQRAVHETVGIEAHVAVNVADGDTADSLYLTVTGLSAEAADDGQVGRGNRSNGLITPYRPMSLEATAGKNPMSHVGKLYNILAARIAHAIVAELPVIGQAECYLLSQIGRAIDEPQRVDIKIRAPDAEMFTAASGRVTQIAQEYISGVGSLWREIIDSPPC